MFLYKNKLDDNLRYYISLRAYKKYRVLIKYNRFKDNVCKKIVSYRGVVHSVINTINIISATLPSSCIRYLIEYPEINKIYLDDYLFLCGLTVSSANKFNSSNIPNLSGCGINIALIDSGVYPHQDLTIYNNKIKEFKDVINHLKYPYDDNGHGTCIAGIICGNGHNSKGLYKGIALSSNLLCYKAFDKLGKGFASDILYCINDIIENNEAKILCLPFELLSNNIFIRSLFDSILNIAVSKGMIPIVPSGSISSKEVISGISTLDCCLTIGGIDTSGITKKIYDYSPCGMYRKSAKPEIVASCININSLNSDTYFISERNDKKLYPKKLSIPYISFSGTSAAVAYVSAICALICEKKPDITLNDIKSLFKISCTRIDDIEKLSQGYGVINTKVLFNFK